MYSRPLPMVYPLGMFIFWGIDILIAYVFVKENHLSSDIKQPGNIPVQR